MQSVDVTKRWKRSERDSTRFKSRNGDMLTDLNKRNAELAIRLEQARKRLREAEAMLDPFRATVSELEAIKMNIQTRLNVWWNEYEGRR